MTDSLDTLHSLLRERFDSKITRSMLETGQITIEVASEHLIEVCTALRDEDAFSFEQLSDLCGIDYLTYAKADWETRSTTNTGFSRGVEKAVYDENKAEEYPARFAVVYHLLSISKNQRLRLRCYIESVPPVIDSVVDIWSGANWFEREAFDMYGILFQGHPDLRRLLTDYGFIGNPFRKDFPLEGNVEVRYDPDQKRVIYQPVTIENRTLVPRVIRHDNRYESEQDSSES